MTYIWEASFRCEKCNRTITRPVHFLDAIDEPSAAEKSMPLEHAKRLHYVDFHTNCCKCGRNIKPGEKYTITDNVDVVMCEHCAQSSK